MKNKLLYIFVIICAIGLSSTAAFYSVTGLSLLFSSIKTPVIIMASFLEASKLVIASLLYQYWEKINKALRAYLSIALITLMLITSIGIYGLLSSGYQTTLDKLSISDTKIEFVENQKTSLEEQKTELTLEKSLVETSIKDLREALGNNVIMYTNKEGQVITTTSSSNRKAYEKQLDLALIKSDTLNNRLNRVNNSILKKEQEILDFKTETDLASEVGPLIYISDLTGKPMKEVINWLILTLIFVFDPLAICLVIAANFMSSRTQESSLPYKENKILGGESQVEIDKPLEEKKGIIPSYLSSWKKRKLRKK